MRTSPRKQLRRRGPPLGERAVPEKEWPKHLKRTAPRDLPSGHVAVLAELEQELFDSQGLAFSWDVERVVFSASAHCGGSKESRQLDSFQSLVGDPSHS